MTGNPLRMNFTAFCSGLLSTTVARPLAGISRTVDALARASATFGESMRGHDLPRIHIDGRDRALADQQDLLRRQNLRFNAALSNMSQGLCMLDPQQRVIVFNERYEEMLGLGKGAFEAGLTLREIAGRIADPEALANFRRVADQLESPAQQTERRSVFISLDDGRMLAMSQRPTHDGGFVATLADITEHRRSEARIDYLAHHDSLTGLPNRVTLYQKLSQFLASPLPCETLAVLSLDLDRFKTVNDTLGHSVGDAVLKVAGARLAGTVRGADTAARVGGDEFAILQRNPASRQETVALARRVIETMKTPIMIDGHKLCIGVSVGIALSPGDAVDSDRLLKMADLALYRVKNAGVSGYCFFDPEMDAREAARRTLELDLRQALEKNELYLDYQPIVDCATTGITGFEALLRWRHPQRGIVPPAEFIPLAEELGLITPIGAWVVRTACGEAMNWPVHISVAVNISPLQISDGGLSPAVVKALAESGLSPRRLELEVTESVLLENSAATLAALHELRCLGIRFSMDDYGTGYSSLSTLRSFPFDKIKIDQSFVRELTGTDQNSLIVQSICSLAAGLGMTTVAEGVETEQQLQLLRAAGCTALQGYLFGRPMSGADALAILTRRRPDKVSTAA